MMNFKRYIFGYDDQDTIDVQVTEVEPSENRSYLFWSSIRRWKFYFTEIVIIMTQEQEAFKIERKVLNKFAMNEFTEAINYFERRSGSRTYPGVRIDDKWMQEWLIGEKITITINMPEDGKLGHYLSDREVLTLKKYLGGKTSSMTSAGAVPVSLSDPRLHEEEYTGGYYYSLLAFQESLPLNKNNISDFWDYIMNGLNNPYSTDIIMCITTMGSGIDGSLLFDLSKLFKIDGDKLFTLYKFYEEDGEDDELLTFRLLKVARYKNGMDYYYLLVNHPEKNQLRFNKLSDIKDILEKDYFISSSDRELIQLVSSW